MAKGHIGVAPFTMAKTAAGGYTNVYAGGRVPEGIDEADLKRLVDEGYLAEHEWADTDEAGDEPVSDKVEDILARVGDDQAAAAAALEQEKAGKNRKTLVSQLEKIAGGGS